MAIVDDRRSRRQALVGRLPCGMRSQLCRPPLFSTSFHTHGLGGGYALVLLFRSLFCFPGRNVAKVVWVAMVTSHPVNLDYGATSYQRSHYLSDENGSVGECVTQLRLR